MVSGGQSFKEKRIRGIVKLYYSRPEIQKAIFEFSRNREVAPSFMMEAFGKRPDVLEYPSDVFQMVKKGATSFHCSEEIWSDPLLIETGMNEKQLNNLRIGWDLLIDIDSKYFDYSKVMACLIIKLFKFHGIENVGVKFSGSKGFHILVPWKTFPDVINGVKTSDMFPEWARIITKYIIAVIEKELINKISEFEAPSKYIRDFQAPKEVMPDLVLVSPRHLFRAPYSLHEKTALVSVVIEPEKVSNFEMKDADALKLSKENVKNFMPDVGKGEAKELLVSALDWYKENNHEEEKVVRKDFKTIKLDKISDDFLPPSIKKILEGVGDGRKRALFILLGLFRSLGMEREELEERVEKWNEKNEVPLKKGYIKAQLQWSYRNKVVPPPNFDKDHYGAIGVVPTPEELRFKNPVNYTIKKSFGKRKK